jgi:hypothetical protein
MRDITLTPGTLPFAYHGAVCRQWRALCSSFTRHVTGSINNAIQEAQPGDTLVIASGFYNVSCVALCLLCLAISQLFNTNTVEMTGQLSFPQETLLVDRPLKLVGELIPNLRGVPRRSVVIQSQRTMAALCNAQCADIPATINSMKRLFPCAVKALAN